MKFTRFLPTQTMKCSVNHNKVNEQHIRIARSMLYSDAFISLNSTAIKLYMSLRIKYHKEEEKNTDFPFSQSLGIKVLHLSPNSGQTIRKGLQDLVKKGFLEQTFISKGGGKNNKISNRYKFSSNWKNFKKEYIVDKRTIQYKDKISH